MYTDETKYREEALTALTSLIQRGLVDGDKINFASFYAGFRAALDIQDLQKTMKQNEKLGKFNIYDFLDVEILKDAKNEGRRLFLSGVYNDAENKKLITTNGNFLIYTDSGDIEENFQNKIVSKDKTIIDGKFPNYKKVIPEQADLQLVGPELADKIKKAVAELGYKTQQQAKKADGVKHTTILIDDLLMTNYMVYMASKFIKTQKSIKIERQEDKTRAWVLTGDNATMIFMPARNMSDKNETDQEIAKAYFDNEKNCLVYNKFDD